MCKLTFLGTAAAIPTTSQNNTHFVVETASRTILVDCPGSPKVSLDKAGILPNSITDIILTHFHPDHVSGFALLVMQLWLMGRKNMLTVHGIAYTLDRAKQLLALHDWEDWPGFYPLNFNYLPEVEKNIVLRDSSISITSSPMQHHIPSIGLRFEFTKAGRSLVYSSDTEPCNQLENLSQNADILITEATGESKGHTSASDAGILAENAMANSLYLIHYSGEADVETKLLAEAQRYFKGKLILAKDFQTIQM